MDDKLRSNGESQTQGGLRIVRSVTSSKNGLSNISQLKLKREISEGPEAALNILAVCYIIDTVINTNLVP